jgi:hypothetical protein
VGLYYTHRYAHAHKSAASLMPYALKGVDCILVFVFRGLGLRTIARPVMERDVEDGYGEEEEFNSDSDAEYIGDS